MRSVVIVLSVAGLTACVPPPEWNELGGADGGGGSGGSAGSGGGGDMAHGGNGGAGGGGGGGGVTVQPEWVNGSRIRARVQTTADGAKAFIGWYDNQLGINCYFARAADDSARCLPISDSASISGSTWADSGCSIPLALSTSICTVNYAYKSEQAATCSAVTGYTTSGRNRMFGNLSQYTGANYWNGPGGPTGCNMYAVIPSWVYYTYGAEIPASTFAAGSIVVE